MRQRQKLVLMRLLAPEPPSSLGLSSVHGSLRQTSDGAVVISPWLKLGGRNNRSRRKGGESQGRVARGEGRRGVREPFSSMFHLTLPSSLQSNWTGALSVCR